jgi:hypothetical protein
VTTDSKTQIAQAQTYQVDPRLGSTAAEVGKPAPPRLKSAPEPDLLKKLVRMIFERELRRMQALAGSPETIPVPGGSEIVELPLRTFLGKHYPELRSKFRWKLARITRRSHLLALRIHTMQALYRLLFEQAMEEEDLSPEQALRLDAKELRDRLGAAFCRNLYVLNDSSKARGGKMDQLEKALAWFDRQLQAWLEWCVSLLPYHAPALGEQDPQSILVRAARR